MENESFVFDISKITEKLEAIPNSFFRADTLQEIGLFFVSKIKMRTDDGVDVNNRPFEPYSANYAKFREAGGYETSKVDLFYSGSMMSALQSEPLVGQKAIRLYFLNTEDKQGVSNPLKAASLNQYRTFFDLSEEDLQGAANILIKKFQMG